MTTDLRFLCSCLVFLVAARGAAALRTDGRPNIVYIMADDLDSDWKAARLDWMPNLNHYFKEGGAYFVNHAAVIPVCGPSRSSMLVGRYPHNHGYQMNGDEQSIANWRAIAGDTVGKWLRDAGYHTAFHGKYVNNCDNDVPTGWSHWGAFGKGSVYLFYNSTCWNVDTLPNGTQTPLKTYNMEGTHQADHLGGAALKQARKALAKGQPFFISVTPTMPHWGACYAGCPPGSAAAQKADPEDPCHEFFLSDPTPPKKQGRFRPMPISPCPTVRHAHAFAGKSNPHIQSIWNVSATGPLPQSMQQYSKLNVMDTWAAEREDMGWRNRSAALLDLDFLIGDLMQGLADLGVINNTYVVFTSDNGYHLGEHKMPFGKGYPYETDVSLPMYVRGPGIAAGATFHHPTTHLDITATIVDLAEAQQHAPYSSLDGKSFKSALLSGAGSKAAAEAWRQYSFSEFFLNNDTWQQVRVINTTHRFSYAWWCTEDAEVFDLEADAFQMANLAGEEGFGKAVQEEFHAMALGLGACSGASCSALPPGAPTPPLQCYKVQPV